MNRLQEDYDPYAVEEPSDEEPALSRWAAAPRSHVNKKKKKKQHRIPTNDELLYDPEKDNRDQAWVDAQRRGHESYKTQYRAMFVMNCSVNREEVLRYKNPENRKKKRGAKKMRANPEGPVETDVEEIYHPVMCTECSTEVAVYDKDEVFHFFNVLASHS
ncbi:hypothetical protein A6R68_03187 [Neotoma lepida]|uniref:E2F-associated phosphoprotein n=1 Tax=Neotoma lepida TaxID=56216 RepID=A0A1A6GPZ8_NEOLE|nr:hypothetical protein A6R68_03187 [Neotoma lepida]